MARKKRQKHKLQTRHAQQAQHQPGQRLTEAKTALRAGKTALAIDLATKALNANLDPAIRAHGQTLLAEAHFRAAAGMAAPADRMAHLGLAIQLPPQQARLHHHAGVTLLRMGRATEAKQAFHAALVLEPGRPGLSFLHQLAQVADGAPWEESGLAEAEVNSLHLAQALSTSVEQADLSDRFADRPLVGQADELWRLLLQMAADPKSAPAARYATALAAAPQLAHSPIAAYYAASPPCARATKQLPCQSGVNLPARRR